MSSWPLLQFVEDLGRFRLRRLPAGRGRRILFRRLCDRLHRRPLTEWVRTGTPFLCAARRLCGLCVRDWWLRPYGGYDPYLTTHRGRRRVVDHCRDGQRGRQTLTSAGRRPQRAAKATKPALCRKGVASRIISVIVPAQLFREARRRPDAPEASERMAQANGRKRRRRAATSPGSSAPMPAIRPRASRTSSIARTWPRGRRGCRSPSTCRPRPGSTATMRSRAAKSARSASRSRISATCGRCSTEIPLASMNTSMTINATAPWLMALYIAVADEQGAPRRRASGHDPERHHQGISGARRLCLPARRLRCG